MLPKLDTSGSQDAVTRAACDLRAETADSAHTIGNAGLPAMREKLYRLRPKISAVISSHLRSEISAVIASEMPP